MAGLIAVIAAFLLASRLMASRFGSFSRSDSLAAREAAEYGLNEIQSQLNSDEYGYLWATNYNKWIATGSNRLTSTDLNNCQISALDSSGAEISNPGVPSGVSSAKEIQSGGGTRITYQVTNYQPPQLPDSNSTTTRQASYCTSSTAAANFGNLDGGSALITVTGSVIRGSGNGAKTTQFRLTRRTNVASPASQLDFSFMILGNAYDAKGTGMDPDTFGSASDIALLQSQNGDICYGTPDGCTPGPSGAIQPTTIGCVMLDSCIVNNVDIVPNKTRNTWCAQKVKRQKKKGYLCNTFQQAAIIDMPATFQLPTNQSWEALAADMTCDVKADTKCDGNDTALKDKKSIFPFINLDPKKNPPDTAPRTLTGLTNASLIKGCYFNVTNGSISASAAGSTAINCLIKGKQVKKDGKVDDFIIGDRNLVVDTSLLPVNFFLYDSASPSPGYAYDLGNVGIENSDRSSTGWTKLRILSKPLTRPNDPTTTPIQCDQTRLISTKDNDINGAFIWLPNGWLELNKTDTKDSSYNVIWTCKFTGPKKKSSGYKIITPFSEDVARLNLRKIVPGFAQQAGSSYRAYGGEDFIPSP